MVQFLFEHVGGDESMTSFSYTETPGTVCFQVNTDFSTFRYQASTIYDGATDDATLHDFALGHD